MSRIALIASLAAFSLFNYAQYSGWNMFAEESNAQPMRSTGGVRSYHK